MLLAVAFGQIIFERTKVERFATGAFEPRDILRVFRKLQKLFVSLDGNYDGNGFSVARYYFDIGAACFHGRILPAEAVEVNQGTRGPQRIEKRKPAEQLVFH
jgi:hypothetical protein